MQKLFSSLLITTLLFCFSAQAQQKAEWKEMNEFHKVMAATFHPSEEGKLEPIKTRSQEVVDKAISWQRSNAPKGYNKTAVRSSLKKLVASSKELNKLIKANVADDVIKEKLSSLHDVFHEIVEKCEKEDNM